MRFTYVARTAAVIGTSILTVLANSPASATADHRAPVRTVASNLSGPFGVDVGPHGRALVAEGDVGRVTSVNLRTGAKRTLISGVPGVAGVAGADGRVYAVLGAGMDDGPPPEAQAAKAAYPQASVLVARADGSGVRVLADLLAYELRHNPDGQVQFGPDGAPYDALSNPFSMVASPWGLLVADGGANDVLKVNPRTGRVSTFFVPPNPRTPECLAEGAQANPGTRGCDSVPTGVAVRGKYVYVSTLGAEQPGAAAIYKLDGRTGKVVRSWRGFTSLTGIAVAPDETIFVSEVLFNAPAGEPPAGFDPATVGRITRIKHGRISRAAVTMPTGMEYRDGKLYATSWSIAGFLGIPDAGRLVEVRPNAFR